MKVAVITISDRAYNKVYEDLSGHEIENILKNNIENVTVYRIIVPDNREHILKALKQYNNADFIITTGGTGLSKKDITPDVCNEYCDKPVPGISEILRVESYKETPFAMLSRGYAGIKDKTLIINLPGSVKAVRTCIKILLPVMDHAIKMLNGEGH